MARTAKPTVDAVDETPKLKDLDQATFASFCQDVLSRKQTLSDAQMALASVWARAEALRINSKAAKIALKIYKEDNSEHLFRDVLTYCQHLGVGKQHDLFVSDGETSQAAIDEARTKGAEAARASEPRTARYGNPILAASYEAGYDEAYQQMQSTREAVADQDDLGDAEGGELTTDKIGHIQQEAVTAFGAGAQKEGCPYKHEHQPLHHDIWVAKWNELNLARTVGDAGNADKPPRAKAAPRKRGEGEGEPAVH